MKSKYELPKEFADKWVDALRSGEYKQGTGDLFFDYEGGDCKYCCLGVAGKISGVSDRVMLHRRDLSDIDDVTKPLMPSQLFDDGYWLQRALIKLNDYDGKTFPEIADWIETNVQFI